MVRERQARVTSSLNTPEFSPEHIMNPFWVWLWRSWGSLGREHVARLEGRNTSAVLLCQPPVMMMAHTTTLIK